MTIKTIILNIGRSVFKIPFLERILQSVVKGKLSNSFVSKFVPNNYQYKKGTYRVFDYNGVMLKSDIHDYVGHYLYFGFKDTSHQKLFSLVNKSDNIIDIGTNIGSTLLQFANKVGEDGQVWGFEPDEFNYKECLSNIKLNNFTNLKVENIGLGDKVGKFKLYIDTETNLGGNRIMLETVVNKNYSIINVLTLDVWVKNTKIEKIDLIKIDVEGFEMNVLKGAEKTINDFKPILFIEIDDNNLRDVGSSAKKLINFLEKKNYLITQSEGNKKISSIDNFKDCHFDIVAIYNQER